MFYCWATRSYHVHVYVLWCSCDEDYRGEYCEFDNPCSPRRQRCLNGGVCRLSESSSGSGVDVTCECPIGVYLQCYKYFTFLPTRAVYNKTGAWISSNQISQTNKHALKDTVGRMTSPIGSSAHFRSTKFGFTLRDIHVVSPQICSQNVFVDWIQVLLLYLGPFWSWFLYVTVRCLCH